MKIRTTRERIIIILLLVGLFSMGTIGYWVYLSFQQLQQDTEHQITTALSQGSVTLDVFFDGVERLLAEHEELNGQTLESVQQSLRHDIVLQPILRQVMLYTSVYSPIAEPEVPLAEEGLHAFQRLEELDTPILSLPYEYDGHWYADVVSHINDVDDEITAQIRLTFDVEAFLAWWNDLNLPDESATTLLTTEGVMWLRLPFSTDFVGQDVATGPLMQAIIAEESSAGIARFVPINTDRIERFVGWQYQQHFGLILASGVSTEYVWNLWLERYLPGLILGMGLLFASAVIILGNGYWIVQSERKLTRYAERLRVLHHLDQAILGVKSAGVIGLNALRQMEELVPLDLAVVTLYDFDMREVHMIAQHTAKDVEPIEIMTTSFDNLMEFGKENVLTGRTRYMPDIQAVGEHTPILQKLIERGLHSVLTVPMLVEETFVGTMTLCSKQVSAYNQEHLEISREIADQIAISLQQARLSEQIRQQNQLLEQRVTERTAALQAANVQLQSLDRLKSQFIAEVSHELRTPLAGLNTRVHLLERDKPEQMAHHLESLKRRIQQLNQLVEQVLDISRLDLTKEQIAFAPVDLNCVVEMVIEAHQTLLDESNLTLQQILEADISPVWGEENQLAQVIANLLTNAIHYTANGTITIKTFAADEHRAGLALADTGMGIAPDDMPHLFDRFYRGKSVSQGNIPGTGLGLSIVKQIIDLHQGAIAVTSELGKGATFTVYLPYAQQHKRDPAP